MNIFNNKQKFDLNDVEWGADFDEMKANRKSGKVESKVDNEALKKNPMLKNKPSQRKFVLFSGDSDAGIENKEEKIVEKKNNKVTSSITKNNPAKRGFSSPALGDSEKDGGVLGNLDIDSSSEDGSSDERIKASRQYHETKFAQEQADFEQSMKKKKETEAKKKSSEEKSLYPIKNEKNKFILNFSGLSPRAADNFSTSPRSLKASAEPRITPRIPTRVDSGADSNSSNIASPRSRTSNAPKFLRDVSKRFSLASDDIANVPYSQTPASTLDELLGGRWNYSGVGAKPNFDAIPKQIMDKLVEWNEKIKNSSAYKNMMADKKISFIRRELGKKFLDSVIQNEKEKIRQELMGSPEKLKAHLKHRYNITVDNQPARSRAVSFAEDDSNFSNIDQGPDVLDFLMSEVDVRMNKNAIVKTTVNIQSDDPMGEFDQLSRRHFVSNYKADIVTTASNGQEPVVSPNFANNFSRATYLYEDEHGNKKNIKSSDEFAQLIGDPQNKQLPYLISHFSHNNVPNYLKDVFFSRTTEDGSPISVLSLYDGSPISSSVTPKSTYLIKKLPDGSFSLKYKGEIDTTGARAAGKNTAYVLSEKDGEIVRTPALIEGAIATWSQEVVFKPNGAWDLKNPSITAKGWNRVSSDT